MLFADVSASASPKSWRLFERASLLVAPNQRTTPDEWGASNRTYPPSSGVPGERDPYLTPYMVPFARSIAERKYRRAVMAMFAQGGKTEAILDVIGQRLDQAPAPILYVGPSKQFLTEQFEPRIMALLDEAPTLKGKVARGKRMTKTRKVIAGVPLRLAHAGSSTALKSDPAALALTDEADELMANVKGQGDPVGLVDARGDTHADFVHGIVSTPSEGPSETEFDESSGLEFWKWQEPGDVASKIWRLWQEGTRHHWAWPCPHCGEYFVPRFSLLRWPKGATASQARRNAYVQCPQGCADPILEKHKAEMNARGVYVAPGQTVGPDGVVIGDAAETSTISFWASGLASPFVSFGARAEAFLKAKESGDQQEVRTVINAGFGELYAPAGGDAPEWLEVQRLVLPYARRRVPDGVIYLTVGVDVQGDRLIYVIRGWGLRQESWLIDHGEIWGETQHEQVWLDLEDLLDEEFEGHRIKRAFVDSGFRPGKKSVVPEHRVYEFCRRNSRIVYATKGYDRRSTPLSKSRIDVAPSGGKSKYGLDLIRLDTDFFKSWVHQRVRWPEDQPGAWHLHADAGEDYCRQIVSEARMRKPSGGVTWVSRSRDNHFLDCESMAYAAAYMLGVQRLKQAPQRPREKSAKANEEAPPPVRGGYLNSGGRSWQPRKGFLK